MMLNFKKLSHDNLVLWNRKSDVERLYTDPERFGEEMAQRYFDGLEKALRKWAQEAMPDKVKKEVE